MKLISTCVIEHHSSTAVDLINPSMDNLTMVVPGACCCSTVGCCCSCSCAAIKTN